jgi:hypothetical protein
MQLFYLVIEVSVGAIINKEYVFHFPVAYLNLETITGLSL